MVKGSGSDHRSALELFDASTSSLVDVALAASLHGDAPQLAYGNEVWTFAEHHAAAWALANAFAGSFGVGRGDRVAIAMRNYPEFSVSFWAAQLIGAIAVPVNAWWQEAEMSRVLDFARPAVVVVDPERLERVLVWARRTGTPVLLARGGDSGAAVPLDEVLQAYQHVGTSLARVSRGDPSTILFTSGTTGAPKGVVHTHANHLANLRRTIELANLAPSRPKASLATMPLFHITQLSSLYINAALGSTTVLMYKWDAAVAVDLIDEQGIGQVSGVPMQVQQLLDLVDDGRELPSLESIGIGATAVPPHLPRRIWQTFKGRVSPLTGYGMTETTSSVTSVSGKDFVERPHSVGRPHPLNDIRIVEDNHEVPVGSVGEIWVRGPNVTTLEWTTHGPRTVRDASDFIPTGDLGSLDADGFLTIAGRVKDIIIRSGENVYCLEVESVLLAMPEIAAAAVVGMPHPRWGEEVTAVIRLKPGDSVDVRTVHDRMVEALAYFKVPTRYHLTDVEFPTTATGKTIKRQLRETFLNAPPDLHKGTREADIRG